MLLHVDVVVEQLFEVGLLHSFISRKKDKRKKKHQWYYSYTNMSIILLNSSRQTFKNKIQPNVINLELNNYSTLMWSPILMKQIVFFKNK